MRVELERKYNYRVSKIDISEDTKVGSAIDKQQFAVVGIILPTLDSGDVTFQVSHDGVTFSALKKIDGTDVSITAGTGGFAVSSDDLAHLAAYGFVKPVTAVVQTADREIIFVLAG